MGKELEDVFNFVGRFGPYQKWMVLFVLIPVSFIISYVNSSIPYQLVVPGHWCNVPGREKTNMSLSQWRNFTIPSEGDRLSQCKQYKMIYASSSDNVFVVSNETEVCTHGWDYDQSLFLETVATTYKWLCDKSTYSARLMYMITIANVVGTFILPVLADKLTGRRIIFYVTLGIQSMFTAAVVWAPTYKWHLLFRFLAGLSYQTNFQMPLITVIEFMPPDRRAVIIFLSRIFWVLGNCFTVFVSWIMPDWRYQALASCVPLILSFMYLFCFLESPRWLLSHGHFKICTKTFITVSSRNGNSAVNRSVLENKIKLLQSIEQIETSKWTLSYPKICLRSLMLLIIAACVHIIQGVTNYNINIHPNYFLNHFIIAVSDLPGTILGALFVCYLGRRFTFIFTFILAGAFCSGALFVIHNEWKLLAMLAFIKLFVAQIIYALSVYSTEIFPTPIRSTGYAWISMCGFTAATAAPSIVTSGHGAGFPFWILLSLSGVSFFASLFLPETMGLPLPQTFQEAEDIGIGRPFKMWIHNWNNHKYLSQSDQGDETTNNKELEVLDEKNAETSVVEDTTTNSPSNLGDNP